MTTISTQQTSQEAQKRKQTLEELKKAAKDWLAYNRKILKAEAAFLKAIKDKRTEKQLTDQITTSIRPFYLKSLADFLGS